MPKPEVTNDETTKLFDMLAQVYRAQGEDAVRAILKQSTLKTKALEDMIAQVKALVNAAPEESPQDKMAKAFNTLVQLYRAEGEDRARAALQQSGLPDAQIATLIEQVKQKAASEQ